uniref:Uncharacterized protein n=1 Tax=Arundo donax TaxID=35708 RepID=A0A0A9VNL6_ARUDO
MVRRTMGGRCGLMDEDGEGLPSATERAQIGNQDQLWGWIRRSFRGRMQCRR